MIFIPVVFLFPFCFPPCLSQNIHVDILSGNSGQRNFHKISVQHKTYLPCPIFQSSNPVLHILKQPGQNGLKGQDDARDALLRPVKFNLYSMVRSVVVFPWFVSCLFSMFVFHV